MIERLNEGHMTNVILDTLTNLSLGPEVVGDIQAQVMRTLSSVSLKDLPVMVKFILQGVQHGTELEVISKLRTVINLSPLPVFSVSSQAALTAMTQRKSLASKKTQQVWSLTTLYCVDFSKTRIDIKKCVFNKRII